MAHSYEFNLGEVVECDGVLCEVIEREIYDDEPDYLLKPCSPEPEAQGFTQSGMELPGWIRTQNIRKANLWKA